jgi:phosphatidylserine decarboxylase
MATEGILFVVVPFCLAVGLLLINIPFFSYFFAVVFFLLTVYMAFFFRDPVRKIRAGKNEIVSPVDGTVLDIVDDGDSNRLVVFLSIFNVHVTRFPYSGLLQKMEYFKGEFLPAYREKASELNERITLFIKSESFSYQLKLIAGIAARRIKMWVKQGDAIKTGNKIGIIMFGSRAELLLPKSISLQIKKGEKITGGLTLIGKINNPG